MSKSFEAGMPQENNLLVIDGFNLAFRFMHSKQRNFATTYLETVMSFANSYNAKQVVVLSDGGSNYRESIYPGYKGARKELRATQSEADAKDFQLFMDDWIIAFELCSTQYPTIRYGGVEADDIAAYISQDKDIQDNFEHIWLLSTDRDWDLLVSEKISRFSYRTRKEVTLENWNEHYDYTPEEHISVKVLQGDKSDSIPGVPGIGEKRAGTLLKEYASAFDIHASLPIQDKRVFMQNLNQFGDQILLNYQLMDLVDYCAAAVGSNVSDLDRIIKEEIII